MALKAYLAHNTKLCYTYNAEDIRIRNLCCDEDTVYTYNTNCKLSQLLVKTTNGVVTKYVYGLGLIGEEKSGEFKTYHFDYRGSTIAVTDASGNVTDTFEYNAYGKIVSRTGNSDIIFCYNGRDGVVTEKNGLIYMRARYYSPDIRRFVNADIIRGAISDSTSLNRYAYVNGNPASLVDPLGLSAERGTVDISTVISASDLRKLQEIYDITSFQLSVSEVSVKALYESLVDSIEKAVRPSNIPRGVWSKQKAADLKWASDVFGPSSKLYKTLDALTLTWIDGAMVAVDAGIGLYENIENNESTREIVSDLAIDIGVGATNVVVGTLVSSAISGAVAGSALGTAVPGIGNIIGFVAGLAVGVGSYYLSEWLDDVI